MQQGSERQDECTCFWFVDVRFSCGWEVRNPEVRRVTHVVVSLSVDWVGKVLRVDLQ